jgi:putative DNA primase/helicase
VKQDINDTLRTEGVDAVRARHDRACRYTNREKKYHRGNTTPRLISQNRHDKAHRNGTGGNKYQDHNKAPRLILPPPSAPMHVARIFVREHCLCDGTLTLRHWRGGWWVWRTSHWVEAESAAVRSLLYAFTEHAAYLGDKGDVHAWAPTRRKIADLAEALSAISFLVNEVDQPCWLDGRRTGTIVAVDNGLLDLEDRQLLPHTPYFFNLTAVPFAYDPHAPEPIHWTAFLKELWPLEAGFINVLGEWFGYVISGRLDMHKIMLMIGPTRAGKGVVARVLTALVGQQNVAGPTLNSLGSDFGLAPLLGKSLAIISDARFVSKNGNVVVERLLAISGEDTLTINRKYRDQWTGKLPSRLHVISNELPKLGDASTAIVGRMVLLIVSRSWLGKEDHALEQKLCAELSGILNWALEGLQRLTVTNGNRFTRVATADEAILMMRDLASPVAAFVREQCETGSDQQVAVDELYGAFKVWAENNGHARPTKQLFGRDLRAAVPSIRVTQPRAADGKQYRAYSGIALQKKGAQC